MLSISKFSSKTNVKVDPILKHKKEILQYAVAPIHEVLPTLVLEIAFFSNIHFNSVSHPENGRYFDNTLMKCMDKAWIMSHMSFVW